MKNASKTTTIVLSILVAIGIAILIFVIVSQPKGRKPASNVENETASSSVEQNKPVSGINNKIASSSVGQNGLVNNSVCDNQKLVKNVGFSSAQQYVVTTLFVQGKVSVDTGEVTLLPFITMHTQASGKSPLTPNKNTVRIVACGYNGNVVVERVVALMQATPARVVDAGKHRGVDHKNFGVLLPNQNRKIRAIYIFHNGNVGAKRIASAHAPTITVNKVTNDDKVGDGKVALSWTAYDMDGQDLKYTLSTSGDGGKTWSTIGVNLPSSHLTTYLGVKPNSQNALLRVQVTDGFLTSSDIAPIEIR